MAVKRSSLRLIPHEDAFLRALYHDFRITTDDYPHRPRDLERLVKAWNDLTGRSENASDVLHYMITRRKKKQWEQLGRDVDKDHSGPNTEFSEERLKMLDAIHEDLQIASDNFALNPDLAARLQREFARRAGRTIAGMILAAAMISRRKAGALATLRPKADENDAGFGDIDQIAPG